MAVMGFAALAVPSAPAEDDGPEKDIPSPPRVNHVNNGPDPYYAVVEGDWGLSRPGAGVVTVIGGMPVLPNAVYSRRNSYHPRYGRAPERGRNEVEPTADRALPDPPESFSRSWSTSSDITPVNDAPRAMARPPAPNTSDEDVPPPPAYAPPTITDPQTYPQNFDPSVIIDPRGRRRH